MSIQLQPRNPHASGDAENSDVNVGRPFQVACPISRRASSPERILRSFSQCRLPARRHPHQLSTAQNQTGNRSVRDGKRIVPAGIAPPQFRFPVLAVLREDPLLAVRILNYPM